ncbi:MAG: winged helix-turn-helix transcriptional regulator [Alphaproteobacteria bacterium]|nr:winged helix-turn-helix transcriptional regulator [Alphaproteobacteria bacterium]
MAPNEARPAEPRDPVPETKSERCPANYEVSRAFGFLVHDVSRLIKRRFERRARQIGLPITRQQAAVVLNIAGNEGVSQAEVATWLGIEPIALVRMLDKLHEEGVVERRAHPTDRRVRTLWLTPAAGPVVERILAINETIRHDAFAGLPPKTRDAVISALCQIKGNLAPWEEAACEHAGESSGETATGSRGE